MLTCLGLGYACLLAIHNRKTPPSVAVQLSKSHTVTLPVNIGGTSKALTLALACKFPLLLHEDSLKKIRCRELCSTSWQSGSGRTHSSKLFDIGHVKIKELGVNTPGKAAVIDQHNPESFCWPFDSKNLLIDLPLRRLACPKNKKDLKRYGYSVSEFMPVRCQVTKGYVSLILETDQGAKTFILSPRSRDNIIHNETNLRSVKIDGFYAFALKSVESTLPKGVDGILGIDFFRQSPIFFNFKESMVYIGSKRPNRVHQRKADPVKVDYTNTGLPIVNITINKKTIPLLLDTGSTFAANIDEDVINTFDLEPLYDSVSSNYRGDSYCTPNYFINHLDIANAKFYNVIAHTRKSEFYEAPLDVPLITKEGAQEAGNIGCPLLKRTNLFCDFPNNKIVFASPNFDCSSWEAMHYDDYRGLILISVNTQLGLLKLVVDTGSPVSFIDKKLVGSMELITSNLSLGNSDYEEISFYPIDLSELGAHIDGILGMNFLKNHPFYIDFENNFVYFEPI